MNLEDQIAQITNPQEFTRLCNAILTAEYGADFQVIDGTRSDEGNDGYVISEKRIVAMHCPIKPERKKDSDYTGKIKSDLEKAVALRNHRKYDIKKWTFMTPRKLSANIIAKMLEQANEVGINANHQESTYLAITLQKHKHIIKEFPNLFMPDIEKKLDLICEFIKGKKKADISKETEIDKEHIYKATPKDEAELDRVLKIRERQKNGNTKAELRSIYYTAEDSVVKLNALLGLLDLYVPIEDAAEDMVGLCEDGIIISQEENNPLARAYLLAQKGYFLSFVYSDLDMKTACQIKAGNLIGLPTVSEEYRQTVIQKLMELEKKYRESFDEAIDITTNPYAPSTLALVLISVGNAAAQRAIYLRPLNVIDRAKSEMQICKRALLTAKDIYLSMQDELGVTNALFSLANNIRFFGEEKEALKLAENTIEVATKYDDNDLLQKAKWLKESLATGKIPDYMAGERRE